MNLDKGFMDVLSPLCETFLSLKLFQKRFLKIFKAIYFHQDIASTESYRFWCEIL